VCFFVIVYNRFVDSSKCDPHDFDPPPSQKIFPARLDVNELYELKKFISLCTVRIINMLVGLNHQNKTKNAM